MRGKGWIRGVEVERKILDAIWESFAFSSAFRVLL